MHDSKPTSGTISRRTWLAANTAGVSGTMLMSGRRAIASDNGRAEILDTRIISRQPENYHGWPTLARRGSGELVLVCSGGREGHICPFGRVELMRSADGGQSWSWPRVLFDGAIDDRDAGILETTAGSLLVTTFTSLAYEPQLTGAIKRTADGEGGWKPARLARWQAAHERLSDEQRRAELGVWMLRSTDGGVTWSARYDSLVNSPHGPIQLTDGRLLYAGKELWREPNRVGVCHSEDDGQSWKWLADIPVRQGDNHRDYHELHAVETADGRIIAHIRNHNAANNHETLQAESDDGGRTWSTPHSIGVWGLPSHLLRLADRRLLMTYGHRRDPLGNQARVSEDGGKSWSEPIILSGDGASGDLGYPSTVQLDDGTLVTVWYELPRGESRAVLRQATWRLTS
ncbi:MAG: sialidase family protein [Pirellulales bacterium]